MTELTILTFGGFELRRGDTRISELESRKVQALAAFLIAHRGQGFSREYLASLLWPEKDGEAGRRNLRQALYNLRSTLEAGGPPLFQADSGSVRFEPEAEYWLDLEAFDQVVQPSRAASAPDTHSLIAAVGLYRGDFLAGLQVPESLAFEDWLVQEQERLREAVLGALRNLVDHYLATGGYSLGIFYARRLLELDPLSEETHRKLMRLYALSGRRSRALAQYESLEGLLAEELDVEPLEETTALYRRVRASELLPDTPPASPEAQGPLLPLLGRRSQLERLDRAFTAAARGAGRVVFVEGTEGAGKTRLVRTFLHQAASRRPGTLVLHGKSFEAAPLVPFGVVAEAFDNALVHEAVAAERLVSGASAELVRRLGPLISRLRERAPLLGGRPGRGGSRPERAPAAPPSIEELAASVAEALALISGGPEATGRRADPVILFLDDLHWADRSSLELLAELAPRLGGLPVLLVAVAEPAASAEGKAGRAQPGDLERLSGHPGVERVAVEALDADAVAEAARSLVGPGSGLGELLGRQSAGLPAAVAELVNLLRDLGSLVPGGPTGWRLVDPVAEAASFPPAPLAEILEARLARLPPSARRLATLAAVAGPRFSADLLCRIEGEDPAVVDASLRLLLVRWLVRIHLGYWADSRQERDLTLWAGSAPGARFELRPRRLPAGDLRLARRRAPPRPPRQGRGRPHPRAARRSPAAGAGGPRPSLPRRRGLGGRPGPPPGLGRPGAGDGRRRRGRGLRGAGAPDPGPPRGGGARARRGLGRAAQRPARVSASASAAATTPGA